MPSPIIRPARPDEYDEIARVWMNSWVSTGLEEASNFLLAKLRARIRLLEGNLSVTEIALEAGFSHASHMARCMRRVLGIKPSQLAESED